MDDSTDIVEWQYVIEALGRLKVPEAVDRLVDALGYELVSKEAATALGQIGDPRTVPALPRLEGPPSICCAP
jgi:HEAT repeat protein